MNANSENIRDRLAQRRQALTDDLINSIDVALEKHGVSEDHPVRRAAAWASQLLGGGNAVKLLLLLQVGTAALDHINFQEAEKEAQGAGVTIQIQHNSGTILPLDLDSGRPLTADEVLARLRQAEALRPTVPTRPASVQSVWLRDTLPECPAPTTQWESATGVIGDGWEPTEHEALPAPRFQL